MTWCLHRTKIILRLMGCLTSWYLWSKKFLYCHQIGKHNCSRFSPFLSIRCFKPIYKQCMHPHTLCWHVILAKAISNVQSFLRSNISSSFKSNLINPRIRFLNAFKTRKDTKVPLGPLKCLVREGVLRKHVYNIKVKTKTIRIAPFFCHENVKNFLMFQNGKCWVFVFLFQTSNHHPMIHKIYMQGHIKTCIFEKSGAFWTHNFTH